MKARTGRTTGAVVATASAAGLLLATGTASWAGDAQGSSPARTLAGANDSVSVHPDYGVARAKLTWAAPSSADPLTLSVQDTAPDGHSVGVRLVTHDGAKKLWPPHSATGGAGDSGTWRTYATTSRQFNYAYIEICLLERGRVLECGSSDVSHPPSWDD